jgi:hypothetical protein
MTTPIHWVPVDAPQPGDLAKHKSGFFDEREVTRVEGPSIWLDILGTETGPYWIWAYTYSRRVKDEGEA